MAFYESSRPEGRTWRSINTTLGALLSFLIITHFLFSPKSTDEVLMETKEYIEKAMSVSSLPSFSQKIQSH
jgi:hypothetical protein